MKAFFGFAIGLSLIGLSHSATLEELGKQMPPFELPALHYPANSLVPVIDQRTMEIHHGKHHQAYIDNVNKLLEGQKEKKDLLTILENLKGKEAGVRNNAGGHWNHAFFWTLLDPDKAKNQMPERITKEIEKKFGSVEKFKEQFEKAGLAQFGSGWVWLIRGTKGELAIATTPNQDNPLMDIATTKGQPILGVDVWEHAYYLNYENLRADYLKSVWNIINWVQVNDYDLEVTSKKTR